MHVWRLRRGLPMLYGLRSPLVLMGSMSMSRFARARPPDLAREWIVLSVLLVLLAAGLSLSGALLRSDRSFFYVVELCARGHDVVRTPDRAADRTDRNEWSGVERSPICDGLTALSNLFSAHVWPGWDSLSRIWCSVACCGNGEYEGVDDIESREPVASASPRVYGASLFSRCVGRAAELPVSSNDGHRGGSPVTPASMAGQLLFTLSVMPFLCVSLYLLGPLASLLACVVLATMAVLAALAFFSIGHLYFFSSSSIATCLVAYPLWSWRRQRALIRALEAEAHRSIREPFLGAIDLPPVLVRTTVRVRG